MSLRIGIVVPHIFMHRDILPHVIFSPGQLALDLADGLQQLGADVTLFTPGPVDTSARNITADLSYFERELAGRGDDYLDLLKKHSFTFITLARQLQSELLARAYQMANDNQLDVIHVYTNEEDIALPFAALCRKPVVFTHHDPFNFLVKYKNVFPKYKHLNWLSMSQAQRGGMPEDTHWVGNIYHGLDSQAYQPAKPNQSAPYVAYLGRVIEAKGVHLAIAAVKAYNKTNPTQTLSLRIAGKHYSSKADDYWQTMVSPEIDGEIIFYDGYIRSTEAKQQFLQNATALIIPSTFEEPFGMVMIEALACGTPLIGLRAGAIPEIIRDHQTGILVDICNQERDTIAGLAQAIQAVQKIDGNLCRQDFEARFTLKRMCQEHLDVYNKLSR